MSLISSLVFKVSTDLAELNAGTKQINNKLEGLTKGAKNLAGAFGLAFGVDQLVTFGAEAGQVAGKLEGVEKAFNKIANGNFLQNLQEQTKGTISDLQLMQATVKANEFGIPIEKMGDLMEFAAIQAAKMGESVDYMAESVTTGLARGSIQILDNLGLSAKQLRTEAAKTGDITSAAFSLINQRLKESGGITESAATSAARFAANWQKVQTALGNVVNTVLTPLQNAFSGIVEGSKNSTSAFREQKQRVSLLEKELPGLIEKYDLLSPKTNKTAEESEELRSVTEKIKNLAPGVVKGWDAIGNQYDINREKLGTLLETEKAYLSFINKDAIKETESRVKSLQKEIRARQEALELGFTPTPDRFGNLREVKLTTEQIIKLTEEIKRFDLELEGAKESLKRLKGEDLEQVSSNANAASEAIVEVVAGMQKLTSEQLKQAFSSLNTDWVTLKDNIAGVESQLADLINSLPSDRDLLGDYLESTKEVDLKLDIETPNEETSAEYNPDDTVNLQDRAAAINSIASATQQLNQVLGDGEQHWATYVSGVLSYIGQLIPQLSALIATQTVAAESSKGLLGVATAATALGSFFALIGTFSKKATGGHSSGLTLVGERGAELVNMGSGGHVTSAHETKRLLSGGNQKLVAEVTGNQLRFILDKEDTRRNRT